MIVTAKPLALGPKYCFKANLKPIDVLSLPRILTRLVPEEERSHCISHCVASIKGSNMHIQCSDPIRPLIKCCVEKKLRPVISDKGGYFLIMPDSWFSEKALTAIKKNFRTVILKLSVIRQRTVGLLLRYNLEKIACNVKKAKSLTLEFFFAKTHKNEVPFRAIIL